MFIFIFQTYTKFCISATGIYLYKFYDMHFTFSSFFGTRSVRMASLRKLERSGKYKACSKKDQTFAIKTLFYSILSTVPFKVVPSTGNTPFPTFLPLLECFLERTFCDSTQFSYCIFLNLCVFKKRPNLLNSSLTSTEGALGY